MTPLPLIEPDPPRLSTMAAELAALEASGTFTNHGPVSRRFEAAATDELFDGKGGCLAVNNATIGLALAIREAVDAAGPAGRFALMPAFTFAATAHAAIWAGLTPLLCDVDPHDWAAQADAEERLLDAHGDRIAVIVPYATFGAAIDLDRYARLSARHGVGVVIDAAASLGTRCTDGGGFAAGAPFSVVFSMHATKTFAVAEGGLIHCGDGARLERLRAMTNFGFGSPRTATMPGLNAKLPEVLALMALAKLEGFEAVCERRGAVEAAYRDALAPRFGLQRVTAGRQSMQFMPLTLPSALAPHRAALIAALGDAGIGAGHYFSPHLGEQPYFQETCVRTPAPHADALSAQVLALPITDRMTPADAVRASHALHAACDALGVRAEAA